MAHYDLLMIGSGPSGQKVAIIEAQEQEAGHGHDQKRRSLMLRSVLPGILAVAVVLGFSGQTVWADEDYGHAKGHGYSKGCGHGKGCGTSGHHGTAGHFLRTLLNYAHDVGLTGEQIDKLQAIQLDLDKTRIKTEAEILIAERELRALLDDEKSDLSAIEAKVRQSEELEIALRVAAIKAKREAKAVLTSEQRDKLKAVHERGERRDGGSR